MRTAWWGASGEWWVAAQIALMVLVFAGPRRVGGAGVWSASAPHAWTIAGAAVCAAGAALLVAGALRLGSSLTPLPKPKEDATLVQSGPYRIVRHPMYAGGIAIAVGWAMQARSLWTLAYAALLIVFLDVKSAREERWLVQQFPEYASYQKRVRKLIPFVR